MRISISIFIIVMFFCDTLWAEDIKNPEKPKSHLIEQKSNSIDKSQPAIKKAPSKSNSSDISNQSSTKPLSTVPSENSDDLFAELTSDIKKYDYKTLDPFIKHNKSVFKLNLLIFRNTMLPLIFIVDKTIPKPIKSGYRNFMSNLLEPKNYVIHALRHDKEKMRLTAKRFFLNTTFGALGLIDVAGRKYKNYSKTMSFDCVFRQKNKPGRYVMFPIVNQYYERSFAASIFDWLLNPIFYLNFPLTYILYGIDQTILLAPNKNLIYQYREYSDAGYELLRDMESHNAFEDNYCK